MNYSFESYIPQTESQVRALTVARKVVDIAVAHAANPRDRQPAIVVFSGRPGVGKTHLLGAIQSELTDQEVRFNQFSGVVRERRGSDHSNTGIVLGDDAFASHDSLNRVGGAWGEINALNELVLNDWYPNNTLVVMTSNFTLHAIQEALIEHDKVGRATSRLREMVKRGADVPIVGPDYRAMGQIGSLFDDPSPGDTGGPKIRVLE